MAEVQIPPEQFCDIWARDTEYIRNPCVSLAAYVAMCNKFNICIVWRSTDYCPCTDSSGAPHAVGEIWGTSLSGCCMQKCVDSETIIPVEYNCSEIHNLECQRFAEVALLVPDDQTCCPQKICRFELQEEKIQRMPPWKHLGLETGKRTIVPQKLVVKNNIKTLADVQQLCGSLNWGQITKAVLEHLIHENEALQFALDSYTGEKSSDAMKHLIQAFSFLGIPKSIKTDNGPMYTSKEFRSFLQQWGVENKTGIPYSPTGQAIVERTHQNLKRVLSQQHQALKLETPQIQLSKALFNLNFLNCTFENLNPPIVHHFRENCQLQLKAKPPVMVKDPATRETEGPHDLITWGRGYACVSTPLGPKWVPAKPCSDEIPKCQEGEVLIVDGNTTDRCCPTYQCKCACETIPKPQCKLGQKLQIDELFQNSTENVCNCVKYKCVRDKVCLSNERGVLLRGQRITEHSADGICHISYCTNVIDPSTKYYKINTSSIDCAVKCKTVGGYVVPFLEGCCKTCKEDGKFCKKVTVRMTIRKNDCRSNTPPTILYAFGPESGPWSSARKGFVLSTYSMKRAY
ncbi:hypothetical protein DUI87_09782 [Hirundo rustica rustica]|uniref:Uncharacterized protein n=1 Tax=Hirundo rustica rustica TaxID=333673 RepID=A0A3M0KMS6_HIRRU|nr:hypothetical protein DUI87_09782 [Hirundo rustica rustica]